MNKYKDSQIKHIYINDQIIMYRVFMWDKFTVNMSIDKNDNCINVYTHPNISQKILQEFIEKNILRFHKFIQSKKSNFELNSKASYIYLLNEKYQVQVIQAKSHRKYEIYNKNIYLQCHKPSDKLFLIKKILSDYCNKFVVPLFNQLAKKMQIKNVKLAFRWMVSKYGVCQHSPINKITLGLQTVSYAKEIIEYLIVHELVHVLHPHHQKSFWNCVAQYIPNWKELQNKLHANMLNYIDCDE